MTLISADERLRQRQSGSAAPLGAPLCCPQSKELRCTDGSTLNAQRPTHVRSVDVNPSERPMHIAPEAHFRGTLWSAAVDIPAIQPLLGAVWPLSAPIRGSGVSHVTQRTCARSCHRSGYRREYLECILGRPALSAPLAPRRQMPVVPILAADRRRVVAR